MSVIENSPFLGTFLARDVDGSTFDARVSTVEPGIDVEIKDARDRAYFTFDAHDAFHAARFFFSQLSDVDQHRFLTEVTS